MTLGLAVMGIGAVVLILALAYDNRHQHHIWEDKDE